MGPRTPSVGRKHWETHNKSYTLKCRPPLKIFVSYRAAAANTLPWTSAAHTRPHLLLTSNVNNYHVIFLRVLPLLF
jgi:hypothetical protein